MEGVIDDGFAVGPPVIIIDDGTQGLAAERHGERYHRRGPAAGRRERAGPEIINRLLAFPGLLIHVAVAVVTAGRHQAADRVDHILGSAELFAEGDDPATADTDVAAHGVSRRGDGAIADQQVERGGRRLD